MKMALTFYERENCVGDQLTGDQCFNKFSSTLKATQTSEYAAYNLVVDTTIEANCRTLQTHSRRPRGS